MKNNGSRLFKTLLITLFAIGTTAYANERTTGYQCVVDIYGEYQASRAWYDYNNSGYFFSSENDVPACTNCAWIYSSTYTAKTEVAAKQQFLEFCYSTFGINVKDIDITRGVRSLTRSGAGIQPLLNIVYENTESLKSQSIETVRAIAAQNRELCREIAATPTLVQCEKYE